jgi:hypothetical protein
MRNALKVTVLVAFLAVPSVALATSGASSSRSLAINCNQEQFKPKRITIACGDAGIYLGKLKWSNWGSSSASATGTYNQNTCTPDCAAGHIKSYPVKVTLSKPKVCSIQANPAFRQAALTYTGARPKSAPAKVTFRCPRLPGGY